MKNLFFFILINLVFFSYDSTLAFKKDAFGHSKFMEQSTKELKLTARKALVNYVKQVILDKENPEGIDIRAAILDHREEESRKKAEEEILSQAEAFPNIFNENNQTYPWQLKKSKNVNNPCLYYSGMIFGLATEIEFEKDSKNIAKIRMEVD